MKKKLVFVLALALTGVVARTSAQNQAVDFYLIEQYDKAKALFEQQLKSGTNPAEANYYLGEIEYAKGNTAQAKTYYERGLAANAEYALNLVGLARFTAKSDPKTADKDLQKAIKMDKKNVTLLLAAAKVYLDNGMTGEGAKTIAAASKADKNSPLVYMFNGDLKKDKDVGAAAAEYEQAIYRNPNYLIPYIKIAQIYVNVNPREALSRLGEAIQKQPDYMPAKEYQARAYYNLGAYDRAIEIYKQIFNEKTSSMNVLTDYAASLFFAKKYDEAMALLAIGVAKDPNDFVLNRLLMYSAYEREEYEQCENAARKFFRLKPSRAEKFIPRDYTTYADGKVTVLSKKVKSAEAADKQDLLADKNDAEADQNDVVADKNDVDAAKAEKKLPAAEREKLRAQREALRAERQAQRNQREALRTQKRALREQRRAALRQDMKDMDAVVENYKRAGEVSAEKDRAELYRLASEKLNKLGFFAEAVNFYLKYIDEQMVLDGEIGLATYFTLGQYAYKAAAQLAKDSTQTASFAMFLDTAESAFTKVLAFEPDHTSSIRFIALVNAQRDPNSELGLAKPHYEKMLGVITEKISADPNSASKYKTNLLEIYRYLSYYYYVQFDAKGDDKTKAQAKESDRQYSLDYCQKMLELDPNNAVAKQLIDALTPQAKPAAKK
jgi:tetratricopeptide (TPR) repeat protein